MGPDPPILAFFDFLAFFVFRFSLPFCAFFLSFPRILGVPRREKPLLFRGKTPCFFQKSKDWRVRGGSSAPYLARTGSRTPCVPLFCTLFNKVGNRRAFRLPGAGGDHFHFTVEPSPGHIRCRDMPRPQIRRGKVP